MCSEEGGHWKSVASAICCNKQPWRHPITGISMPNLPSFVHAGNQSVAHLLNPKTQMPELFQLTSISWIHWCPLPTPYFPSFYISLAFQSVVVDPCFVAGYNMVQKCFSFLKAIQKLLTYVFQTFICLFVRCGTHLADTAVPKSIWQHCMHTTNT